MKTFLTMLVCVVMTACGGGGESGTASATGSGVASGSGNVSGSEAGTGSGSSDPSSSATLSGVAATGSAIVGRIYLKDAASHEQFVDTTNGSYTFSLTGVTSPYMLKAEWVANGTTKTLYSFASSSGTANITPLTNMAVIAAAAGVTLDSIYAAPSTNAYGSIATALPAAITDLQKALAPLLAKYSSSTLNPITGVFAPDHTGMDALLDSVRIAYQSGDVTVTDTASGAIVLDAPSGDISHGLTVADWSANDAMIANDPDVAVDVSGKDLVVWSEQVASKYVIRARFMTGTSASAVTISTSGDSSLPRVAYDGSGNATAVWAQYENNRNDIWTSHFVAANNTWSGPSRISTANAVDSAYVPDIAVDGTGNAIVTWHQGDGRTNHFDAWSARYVASSNAWGAPALISDGINSAYDCRVAVNVAGQGIIAWEQGQGDGTTVSNGPKDIWGRSVGSAGTLGTSIRLNAVAGNVNGVYGQVAVAVDSNGNGAALWVQSGTGQPFVIQAAMYSASSGWQASAVITNNVLESSYGPHLAFDSAGNAIAVWQQQDGFTAFGGTNRYVAGVGWGVSGTFASSALGDVYDPRVAMDGAGNATVVWYQTEQAGTNVRINRYLVGSGWGAPVILSTTSTDGMSTYPVPRVAANVAGQAIAVWGIDSM